MGKTFMRMSRKEKRLKAEELGVSREHIQQWQDEEMSTEDLIAIMVKLNQSVGDFHIDEFTPLSMAMTIAPKVPRANCLLAAPHEPAKVYIDGLWNGPETLSSTYMRSACTWSGNVALGRLR